MRPGYASGAKKENPADKGQKDLTYMIEQLKSCESLPYVMLPVLRELESACVKEVKTNATWENGCIQEIEGLIRELGAETTKESKYNIYGEIMKSSTYLIDMELWIKVMELLISESQGIF